MVNNQLDILKSNIPGSGYVATAPKKVQPSDARLRLQTLSREYTDKLVGEYERIKYESISALSGIKPYWDKLLITIKKTPPAADIPDRPAHPARAPFRLYKTAAICAALVFSGSAGAVNINCDHDYKTWCSGVAYPDNTGVISGVLIDGKWVPNGIFTVPDDQEFSIDVPLLPIAPSLVSATGWDGKSLTKLGGGTLTMNWDTYYTGSVFINAGTLRYDISTHPCSYCSGPYRLIKALPFSDFVVAKGAELKLDHNDAHVTDVIDVTYLMGVISGDGTVTQAGSHIVALTGENTYTGGTTIAAGSELWIGVGNAKPVRVFGDCSSDPCTDINADLTGSVQGDIVNNGLLRFMRFGSLTYGGVISGAGTVIQGGAHVVIVTDHDYRFNSMLTLTGENTYTGGTIVSGRLRIGDGGTTGSVKGDIALAQGNLIFNRSDDVTYGGVISGEGAVFQAGTGTLTLTGESTYIAGTFIDAGTLKTGVADAFADTYGVIIADGARLNLGGHSQTLSMLNNGGVVLFDDLGAPSDLHGVTVTGNMNNHGMLVLNTCGTCAGQVLTLDGDWAGNGGSVSFGTVLGGDDSQTDKLIITGAATGTTYVTVTNEGGAGAGTVEGIALIQTASSTENAFVQQGRIVAGAYDYRLQQGSASGKNANNWYLTSLLTADESMPPGDDVGDGTVDGGAVGDATIGDTLVLIAADDPVGASTADAAAGEATVGTRTPGGGSRDAVHVYRPEAGSYASNLAAAGTMFNMRLSDRQSGESVDPATGARHRLWARTVSGRGQGRMSDGQNQYTAERSVLQLGGSVLGGSFTGKDVWRLGVMAGYGSQRSKTRNRLSGYSSHGRVGGYGAGLYGTWYQDGQTRTGLYLDGWAFYNRFDNTVKGDGLANEQYTSRGITASVESGYLFDVGSYTTGGGRENRFSLRPEAQLLWSGVNADDRTERSGTKVQGAGGNGVQTRLGARLSMTSSLPSAGQGNARAFETFLEANWLHTPKPYGVTLDETRVSIQGSRNVAELKAGVQGYLSERLSVSADVTRQQGDHGYRDTQGTLKVTYRF